jgi:hypothetical protein
MEPNISRKSAWHSLATLLGSGNANVEEQVAEACDNPEAYLERYGARLGTRGIHSVEKVRPLIALVDALIENHRLAEVDWNAELRDVLWNLDAIRLDGMASDVFSSLESEIDSYSEVDEVLPILSRHLGETGFVIGTLDLGSDSHAMFVCALLDEIAVQTAASGVAAVVTFWK